MINLELSFLIKWSRGWRSDQMVSEVSYPANSMNLFRY